MKKFTEIRLLMSPEQEGGGGGSGQGNPSKESAPKQEGEKGDQVPEESGDNFDEFGYEKTKEETPASGEAPKGDDKGVQKSSPTGYGEEEKPEEVKEEETPPPAEEEKEEEEKPKEEKKTELSGTEGLLPSEIEEIRSLSEKLKLTPEQTQALVESKKEEVKKLNDLIKQREEEKRKKIEEIRAAWKKELKEDKDFGGENFEMNLRKVDKLVEDFMPNLKKQLTENRSMLPPYLMRDLAKIAKALHSTESFKNGEPVNSSNNEEDDPLAYYS